MRKWLLLIAGVSVIFAGATFWRAGSVVRESRQEQLRAGEIAFRADPVRPVAGSGVESIGASATFIDVAVFQDRLYLSGPAGLFAYDRTGSLQARYLTGTDLPPAPPGRMVVTSTALLIATNGEGLLAFDGSHFEQIRPESRDFRQVNDVLPLGGGRILLGTAHGLLIYDGRTLKPGAVDAHITALAGQEGDLWIGTLASGAYYDHGGQLDHLDKELPDARVLAISLRDSAAFIGTPLGVTEFRRGRKARSLAEGYFARAVYAGTRGVSVGTQDEGVIGEAAGPLPGAVQRIVELDGAVFALTDRGLHERSETGVWRNIIRAAPGLLTDHNVSALSVSSSGRLWVGYFDRGLDLVDVAAGRVKHLEDDQLFCINRIVSDGTRTAVATANGLVMFDSDEKPRQVLTRKSGLLADHVTDVAFRRDGFVAATPAGLTFVDNSGIRSLYALHGLVNNHVYALAIDGSSVAAGTLGGLSLLDGDVIRASYTTANSHLRHNWITALVRSGREWFAGTYGAGVLRLDEQGEWQSFADLGRTEIVINPNAMLATDRHIFAGTLDHGLLIFDRASQRWHAFSSGLASRNVTALAASHGALYVGTDNGVARIEESRFE